MKISQLMKKSVLFYSLMAGLLFSLQSCVSNYVVATPSTYKPEVLAEEKSYFTSLTQEYKKELESNKAIEKPEEKTVSARKMAKKKSSTIDGILSEANTYIGTPYRFGGMTRSGIDCSAFVLSVYGSATGINLPRISSAQAQEGERVEREQLEKGDLLFFQTRGSRISHVGIVQEITPEGEIKFIHASTSKGVTISSLNEKYWSLRFRFAKRILTNEKIQEMASL